MEKSRDDAEKAQICGLINTWLKDDPAVAARLPLNPDNNSLYDQLTDGIILAKLVY